MTSSDVSGVTQRVVRASCSRTTQLIFSSVVLQCWGCSFLRESKCFIHRSPGIVYVLECDCAYVECFQRNVEWLNGMNHDKCEGQVKETGFSVFKKKKSRTWLKVRAWEWATSNACTAVTVVHVWSFLQHTCRGRKVALKCGTLEIAWCCHILSGPRWVLWQWGETLTATLAAAEKKSVGDGDRMTCCYVTEIKLMLTES